MLVEDMTPIQQYKILYDFIHSQVNRDFVYLDAPTYLNVGDMLITLGIFEILKTLPYKCLGRYSNVNSDSAKIPSNAIILMQGGGNFGDLYPGANWLRIHISKRYPNNKIIILPVTTTYNDSDIIEKEAEVLGCHPNLCICARDKQSYVFLNRHFGKNHIVLVPDCAFGLSKVLPQKSGKVPTHKVLYMKRKDFELPEEFVADKEVEYYDWDDILNKIGFNKVYLGYRITRKISKLLPSRLFQRLNDMYLFGIEYKFIEKKVPCFFLQYDRLNTTRMHGLILAFMMGIPTDWVDTKFGKIRNYVNTWIDE